MPKKKMVGPFSLHAGGEGRKVAIVLDDVSLQILDALQKSTDLSRAEVSRMAISDAVNGSGKSRIAKFYYDEWPRIIVNDHIKRVVQFGWSNELDHALLRLAKDVLGAPNRSEMFRVIVAAYALEKRAVTLVPTKAFEFKIL